MTTLVQLARLGWYAGEGPWGPWCHRQEWAHQRMSLRPCTDMKGRSSTGTSSRVSAEDCRLLRCCTSARLAGLSKNRPAQQTCPYYHDRDSSSSLLYIALVPPEHIYEAVPHMSHPWLPRRDGNQFIHSFIRSFMIHSFIHSFVHSFIHSFVHSFIHSFVHSFIHPPVFCYLGLCCYFLDVQP